MNDRSKRELNYDTYELDLKHIQVLFVEWLCGDHEHGETQAAFAKKWDVNPGTLSKWKKDPSFCAQWEKRMRETHAHPDKQNALLDKLYNRAHESGDPKDVEAYFRLIDRMTPDKLQISGPGELEELSDEDLRKAAEDAGFLRSVS